MCSKTKAAVTSRSTPAFYRSDPKVSEESDVGTVKLLKSKKNRLFFSGSFLIYIYCFKPPPPTVCCSDWKIGSVINDIMPDTINMPITTKKTAKSLIKLSVPVGNLLSTKSILPVKLYTCRLNAKSMMPMPTNAKP